MDGCCGLKSVGGIPIGTFEEGLFVDGATLGISDSLVDAGPTLNAVMASLAAGPGRRYLRIPPGTYSVATPIVQPANLVVWGSGPQNTTIRQVGDIPLWSFAATFARSELAHLTLQGQGDSDPLDPSLRLNIGLDLNLATFCTVHDVEVWDFLLGLRFSDGAPFSGYNDCARMQLNRCTTGVRALKQSNANTLRESRVFFSFGAADEGIGLDVDDASALAITGCAFEACDTCVRVASSTGTLRAYVGSCYLEPGVNSFTASQGRLYDVNLPGSGSNASEMLRMEQNFLSGNFGRMDVDPEGFSYNDGFSKEPFGARYDGAAVPRRNLIRNGYFLYYNAALIPNWTPGGTVPTIAENIVDQVTGVRCLQVTANAADSRLTAGFEASDQGSGWVTVGVRYQVLAGNVGFTVSITVGGGPVHQWVDFTPDPGVWKVGYVQVPVGGVNRQGQAIVLPDVVNGTGAVLIDEMWAVPGRYAIPSTQYGERIEMLPAPIQIATTGAVAATTPWGPVDILNLPSVLAPPLDKFSAAPEGVVGAVVRLEIAVFALPNTPLPNPYSLTVNVPAAGGVVAASTNSVIAVYGSTAHDGQFLVRSTSLSGTLILAAANGSLGTVFLCGWILQ